MRAKHFKEGLADMANKVELDHEVQMARSDLYKIAKYSTKIFTFYCKLCFLYY